MSKIKRGLKNFSYLSLGTIIAQGIGFIGVIYLARYLGTEHYGVFVTVGAFAGIFNILALGGLRKVITRECSRDPEHSKRILNETVGLQSVSVAVAVVAMLIASLFTDYPTTTKLYIAIFSLQVFSNNFMHFFNTIYISNERMEYISLFNIIRSLLFVGSAILLLTLGFGLFTVVMLSVGTSLMDVILRYRHSRKLVIFNICSPLKIDRSVVKPSMMFSGIKFVGSLHSRVDLLMISFLASPASVAIYGVAYTLGNEVKVMGDLIRDAFFPVAVKTFHHGTVAKRTIVRYTLLFTFGMLGMAIMGYYLAEPLVLFLFGEDYAESGHILRILVFYLVAYFSTIPFTEAAQATGNEKVILYGKGVMAGLNIPLNLILFGMYGLIGIAYSTLIIYTIGSLVINVYSYVLLKEQRHIM